EDSAGLGGEGVPRRGTATGQVALDLQRGGRYADGEIRTNTVGDGFETIAARSLNHQVLSPLAAPSAITSSPPAPGRGKRSRTPARGRGGRARRESRRSAGRAQPATRRS